MQLVVVRHKPHLAAIGLRRPRRFAAKKRSLYYSYVVKRGQKIQLVVVFSTSIEMRSYRDITGPLMMGQ